LNEEDKEAAEAEAAESEASTGNANEAEAATTASAPTEAPRPTVNQTSAPRDSVKRVLMPIEPRGSQVQKPETKSTPIRTSVNAPTQPDVRPRRTQP
jgi:hypothetical protein